MSGPRVSVQSICSLNDFALQKRVKPAKIGGVGGEGADRANRSTACLKGIGEKKDEKSNIVHICGGKEC